MTRQAGTFTYISSLVISLLFSMALPAQEKRLAETENTDSVPMFNGFSISLDLVGIIQKAVSDYGQVEAAVKVNLLDRYFPTLEAGMGFARHDDVVTEIYYKSSAPFFRLGMDYNLMKDKHDAYRIYGGARYAFSYFSYDLKHPGVKDPVWGGVAAFSAEGVKCHYHWVELSAGVDAKIWGPLHLGWSVRYRKRLFHDNGDLGNVWYVPGFGESGNTRLGGMFYITLDI